MQHSYESSIWCLYPKSSECVYTAETEISSNQILIHMASKRIQLWPRSDWTSALSKKDKEYWLFSCNFYHKCKKFWIINILLPTTGQFLFLQSQLGDEKEPYAYFSFCDIPIIHFIAQWKRIYVQKECNTLHELSVGSSHPAIGK